MSPEQVNLITQSFDEMWPIRRNLAAKFYARFFENAPDAQRLFPTDMERQYLKNHTLFQSIIAHTARQHARFGVTASQLSAFGEALIWALEQQFGSAFTSEMRRAWIELYDDVQSEMLNAAKTTI